MQKHRRQFDLNDMSDAFEVSLLDYRSWQRGGVQDRKQFTDEQLLSKAFILNVKVPMAAHASCESDVHVVCLQASSGWSGWSA